MGTVAWADRGCYHRFYREEGERQEPLGPREHLSVGGQAGVEVGVEVEVEVEVGVGAGAGAGAGVGAEVGVGVEVGVEVEVAEEIVEGAVAAVELAEVDFVVGKGSVTDRE